MPVVGRVDNLKVTLGGEPHSGWLPAGAAVPLPTPKREVVLSLTIESVDGYFLLIGQSQDGSYDFDDFHESLESALAAAEESYGVPRSSWGIGSPAAG